MKSLFHLLRDYPALRIYSIRSGLAFGAFLAMWSCLAFKMGNAPFYADSDVIGGLGLCGIAWGTHGFFRREICETCGHT